MRGEIQSIQILRFVAASLVVLVHCASGQFLPGVAGVDIFFVISGFIITRIMSRHSPASFVKDRLTRIYPIYWICLLPMVLLSAFDSLRLASSITLWPVFGRFQVQYLPPSWTLCFEMLFYSAAALILWRRWFLAPIVAAYLAAMPLGYLTQSPALMFIGSPLVLEFGFGVILAKAGEATSHRTLGALAILVGAVVIFLARDMRFGLIESAFTMQAPHRAIVWGLPAAAIVWGALQLERPFKHWFWKLASYGGNASYSIYLSHGVFMELMEPNNPYLKLAMAPVYIVLGMGVHSFIEAPMLRLIRGHKRATSPVEQRGFSV